YGNRKVSETEGREDINRREDKAWDTFNEYKKECLKAYLKARETGKIETHRARRRHRCEGEDCMALLTGRGRFCDICKRVRNREAARVSRRRNQSCSVISYTREITPKNIAFGYRDTPNRKLRGFWQNKQRLLHEIGEIKRPQPTSLINAAALE